jgi:hypothetical protein
MLTVIAASQPPRPERAGFLTQPIARMLDPDPRSRWSMADAAYALQQLADQHALGDTREATAAFAGPVGASADPETQAAVRDPEASADAGDRGSWTGESDSDPDDHDGRGRTVVVGALVLALATVAALILLKHPWTDPGPAGSSTTSATPSSPTKRTPTPNRSNSPATSTSTHPSTGSGPQPTDDTGTEPPSTSTPTPTAGQSPAAGAAAEQIVANYYAALPEDTEAGWSLLSPEFQSRIGGYGNYRGFWSTIASVVVGHTTSVGHDAVDVSLTYTSQNGHVEDEVRRIYLVRTDDGVVISRDAVVG